MNYKSQMTLNEKDSLIDALNLEKETVKMYSTALTEGTSKGFRTLIKKHFGDASEDQVKVFFLMTDHGYAKVESAPKEAVTQEKTKFTKEKTTM